MTDTIVMIHGMFCSGWHWNNYEDFFRAKGYKFKGVKMQQYFDRIIRAAKLDVNLYEEVEADKGAMGQAISLLRMNDYDMCRLKHERR